MRDPLAGPALVRSAVAIAVVFCAALVATIVRLLPLVLDPSVASDSLAPFAKSLLVVALEASWLTGWPVGWALATQRYVERGEARVFATLGESPRRSLYRLLPQGLVWAAVLGLVSASLAEQAALPGRVVEGLIEGARASCEPGQTRGVPFASVTWLCSRAPDRAPRLVGRAPLGGLVFSAAEARVGGDLRDFALKDVFLLSPGAPSGSRVHAHVDRLVVRGMTPWARASSVPPLLRAGVMIAAGLASACAVTLAIQRMRRRRISSVLAVVIGAAGPLAVLSVLRMFEIRVPSPLSAGWTCAFLAVPLLGVLAVFGVTVLVTALPGRRRTGST